MAPRKSVLAKPEAALRKIGLSFPEATEDFPWGHRALKVKGKMFLVMALEEKVLSVSVKLPDSADFALMQPFASPTAYGMGKSGWITSRFGEKDRVPVDLLGAWIRESYLAIAPKRISGAKSAAKAAKGAKSRTAESRTAKGKAEGSPASGGGTGNRAPKKPG